MKTHLFLILLLFVGINPLYAQKVIEKKLPYANGQLVNLNLRFADSIVVRYWDSNQVSVKISVTINSNRLNDALLVSTTTTSGEIGLKTDFDKDMLKNGKAEDCPDSKHEWSTSINGQTYFVCSNINYVVYLPKQAKLNIETISGNIDIQGSTGAPVFAKSISGFIDFSWPGKQGANLAMKTITGEVYTDLDIAFTGKREKHAMVGYLLKGTVNGGGPDVHLESISNNVYLRRGR